MLPAIPLPPSDSPPAGHPSSPLESGLWWSLFTAQPCVKVSSPDSPRAAVLEGCRSGSWSRGLKGTFLLILCKLHPVWCWHPPPPHLKCSLSLLASDGSASLYLHLPQRLQLICLLHMPKTIQVLTAVLCVDFYYSNYAKYLPSDLQYASSTKQSSLLDATTPLLR